MSEPMSEKDLETPGVDTPGVDGPHFPPKPLTKRQLVSDFTTVLCCGVALISDGLQNNIMTMTNVIFGILYPVDFTSDWSTRMSNAVLIGALIGELGVGYIADRFGRKSAITLTTAFTVVGLILTAAAHGAGGNIQGFFWFMTISRGITGVGVGGEYPASSASAVECADERYRKWRASIFIMVTNFVLCFGTPFACILFLIVFSAAGGSAHAYLPTVWRTMFGISIIPPLLVFIFRIRMTDSTLYKKHAIKYNVPWVLTVKYYWKTMIGTTVAWFLYDFVTFPASIFSGVILASVINSTGNELVKQTAEWQLLLGTIALPGCFVGAYLVNKPFWSRRNTMVLGFFGYIVIGVIVGAGYSKISTSVPAFVVLYGLLQFTGQVGPGDMLGLICTESYATPVRSKLYGLSAACGGAGAIIGTQVFEPLRNNLGANSTFYAAAIVGLIGMVVCFFFVRNDISGDLEVEDQKFAEYLAANGWHGETGHQDKFDLMEAAEKQ